MYSKMKIIQKQAWPQKGRQIVLKLIKSKDLRKTHKNAVHMLESHTAHGIPHFLRNYL